MTIIKLYPQTLEHSSLYVLSFSFSVVYHFFIGHIEGK